MFRQTEPPLWDDHRYYHHSLVNQSLHLLSALSFVCAYVVVFKDPAIAALIGWLIAMVSRQVGHLFFEPKSYDFINEATHEYKEEIKVGYNIRRKIVLLAIWALSPVALYFAGALPGVSPRSRRRPISSGVSATCGSQSDWVACCSGPCSSSSSRTS